MADVIVEFLVFYLLAPSLHLVGRNGSVLYVVILQMIFHHIVENGVTINGAKIQNKLKNENYKLKIL